MDSVGLVWMFLKHLELAPKPTISYLRSGSSANTRGTYMVSITLQPFGEIAFAHLHRQGEAMFACETWLLDYRNSFRSTYSLKLDKTKTSDKVGSNFGFPFSV